MKDNHKHSVLLVCNTPFQILMACHIVFLFYKNYNIDIAISDGIRNGDKLVDNARKTNYFRSVFFIHNKKSFLLDNSIKSKIKYILSRIYEVFRNYFIVRSFFKNKYDIILFSNISILTKLLVFFIRKKNRECKLGIFEEGLVTYTKLYASGDDKSTLYSKFIDSEGIFPKIDFVYLCHPNLLEWNTYQAQVIQLPSLQRYNKEYIELLNIIFDYSSNVDVYDAKVIFFEESHCFEGFVVPDIDIVNKIAEKIGPENIMIKIHPRNPINRFSELGYKTNINTIIPWEVIMLNQEFDDKIFVTISSGAVVSPYLYIGLPCVSYSLLNCLLERPGFMNGSLGDMMQRIYSCYSGVFKTPKTIDEFLLKL